MRRIALLLGTLLAALGCSTPTAPDGSATAARTAHARSQLDGASQASSSSGKLATN